jgi:hypothetical protein
VTRWLLVALGACVDPLAEPPAEPPPALAGAWVGGCKDVLDDGACLVAPGNTVVVWLPDEAPEEVRAYVGDDEVGVEADDVGAIVRVVAPAGPDTVRVEAGGAVMELELRAPRPIGDPLDDVSTQIRRRHADPKGDDRASELAAELRVNAAAHLAAGHRFAAVRDAQLAVWLLRSQPGGWAEARRTLTEWSGVLEGNLDAAYLEAFHGAFLESDVGAVDLARRRLDYAAEIATRLRRPDWVSNVREVVGQSFAAAGQYQEAIAIARELEQSAADPCALAAQRSDLAWTGLLAIHSGAMTLAEVADRSGGSPQSLLMQARDGLLATCGDSRSTGAHIGINLALASLVVDGAPRAALEELDQIPQEVVTGDVAMKLWDRWIRLRAGLALGDLAVAAAAHRDLSADAAEEEKEEGAPVLAWRACVGGALIAAAAGDDGAALRDLRRCAEMRAEAALHVAVNGGRDTFVADSNEAVQLEVAILVRTARTAEAFARLRAHRAGHLTELVMLREGPRSAEQVARRDAALERYAQLRRAAYPGELWKLSAEALAAQVAARAQLSGAAAEAFALAFTGATGASVDLAPPEPGELILTWSDGLGFAATEDGVVARPIEALTDEPTPEDLARALFAPFQDRLADAERVTIAPAGRFARFDLHAAAVDGGALALDVPVAWSLDLSRPGVRPGAPRRALVISDPVNNLPHARNEGQAAASALASAGAEVVQMVGPEATLPAVLDQLGRVDLLHFAGHGVFSEQGWSAGLALADGRELLATDVLTAPAVPPWVVLSGCSTAASRPSMVESMGLAQAFLVAGSAEVVATTRPVHDMVAARFAAAWHASMAQTGDGGIAYRDAVRAVSDGDWAAFRRLVF